MNIHGIQAKAVLRNAGVPVPPGIAALSVDEAVAAAKELGSPVLVVKAQNFLQADAARRAASRSCASAEEVRKEAQRLLGSTLITHQTGPHGKEVNRLYVEEGSAIDREFYLSALCQPRGRAHRLRIIDRRRHGHRGSRPP